MAIDAEIFKKGTDENDLCIIRDWPKGADLENIDEFFERLTTSLIP